MKDHRYWGTGALICLIMCIVSGYKMTSKEVHKFWALSTLGCMLMSFYSGHKIVGKKQNKLEDM